MDVWARAGIGFNLMLLHWATFPPADGPFGFGHIHEAGTCSITEAGCYRFRTLIENAGSFRVWIPIHKYVSEDFLIRR